MGKPSRSEDLGTPQEQEQGWLTVERALEAKAPKRPLKPARSDAADQASMLDYEAPSDPPEYQTYQELISHSKPLETTGSGVVSEDYTENDYYESYSHMDPQHHTTGTGFINLEQPQKGFHLSAVYQDSGIHVRHPCNPAMNDWVPSPNTSPPASHKPPRSEALES